MFIIFGSMCMLAAIQFYFTYPETCGKTIEEIEELFLPGAPKPWHTKPGHSRLDAMIDEANREHLTMADIQAGKRNASLVEHHEENIDNTEKV